MGPVIVPFILLRRIEIYDPVDTGYSDVLHCLPQDPTDTNRIEWSQLTDRHQCDSIHGKRVYILSQMVKEIYEGTHHLCADSILRLQAEIPQAWQKYITQLSFKLAWNDGH